MCIGVDVRVCVCMGVDVRLCVCVCVYGGGLDVGGSQSSL